MDVAETPRTGLPLRHRLAAASPWPRKRIVGEAVLTVTLSGIAGLLYTTETGSVVRGGALALAVAVLSLARRALPATVLMVSSALAAMIVGTFALLIYASWSAGSRIERPARALAAYAAGLALHLVLTLTVAADEGLGLSPLVTVLLGGSPFLVMAVVPGLASRYRAQRHALLDALRRHNAQLVREQAMVARQARLLERQRIAQDMHDSLGHQLALIAVHAGALEVDPELNGRRREGVGILREAARSAMRELREAVGILRDDVGTSVPGPEDAGTPADRTAASVDELVASSRAAGATVELHRSGTERALAPAADRAAYRIAQEGLTNAYKHAPGAPITVALRYEPDSLVVEVANGPVPAGAPAGPPAISGGQGLTGLRERARLVGGMVHTGPTPDGGFRLAGVLPYGDGERRSRPDDATFVAVGDDFRGQIGEGSAGDGGDVIGRTDPQKEFATIMSSKKNVALGCALTAVVLVVGVGALLFWGWGNCWTRWRRASSRRACTSRPGSATPRRTSGRSFRRAARCSPTAWRRTARRCPRTPSASTSWTTRRTSSTGSASATGSCPPRSPTRTGYDRRSVAASASGSGMMGGFTIRLSYRHRAGGRVIRVLVADDEPLIRAGIRMILTSADDIDVVAEARDGREAVETARGTAVDVALLDIQMPVMDGLTALAELGRVAPGVRVLILTTFGERDNVLRALGHGSAGFLLKDSAPQELIHAVRAAAAGNAYLSPAATRHVVDSLASPAATVRGEEARRRLAGLTAREREVLALLGEGLSNADAGARLHMSEATVKTYVSRILTKLDCDNRVQAALLARDAGLEPTAG